MSVFATEFPVKADIGKAKFVALTAAWVQGMQHTSLDFVGNEFENYGDEAVLLGRGGEKLTVKELDVEDAYLVGARHDFLESSGLSWRTECVLTKRQDAASLRVRVQCLSSSAEVPVKFPKRPFFIKACLGDGWGGLDGEFNVAETPHTAPSNPEVMAGLLTGNLTSKLPVLFLSALDGGGHVVDPTKLAYDLGGVAHIVTEPSRDHSFGLREVSGGANPYGGTIGVILPRQGVVRRFWLGGFYADARALELAIRNYIQRLASSQSVVLGYDWQELQSRYARKLRISRKEDASDDKQFIGAYVEALEQELTAKDETIASLKDRIDALIAGLEFVGEGDGIIPEALVSQLGRELYPGEFSDRVRAVLSLAAGSEALAIDPRSSAVLDRVLKATGLSGRHSAIISDLKSAAKQDDRAVGELLKVLKRLDYSVTKDGKHFKATPSSEFFGLRPITVVNTPSDWRSLENTVSQICELMGLTTIKRGK